MIGLWMGLAWAGPAVEATAFVGARTAPESSIQVPAAWEGEFEPSGLVAARGEARWGGSGPAWGSVGLGAWMYAPETEAATATATLAGGLTKPAGKTAFSLAGRYAAEAYPWLVAASNGRAEAIARLAGHGEWARWAGALVVVDRRFVGEAGFTAAELSGLGGWSLGPATLDVGLAAEGNAAPDGALGGQGRTLLRLGVAGKGWSVAAEHRFIGAVGGEVEGETRAAFTPVGGYDDDIDALSGGGFVQQRVGVSGALTAGGWTVGAGGFARFRSAFDADEAAVAFARTASGQARVAARVGPERADRARVEVYAEGGAAGAAFAAGGGYTDAFAWAGVSVRGGGGAPRGGSTGAE